MTYNRSNEEFTSDGLDNRLKYCVKLWNITLDNAWEEREGQGMNLLDTGTPYRK